MQAIASAAAKLDVSRETLQVWVRRGRDRPRPPPGLTTDEWAWLAELEREAKELRRANEILNKPVGRGGADDL